MTESVAEPKPWAPQIRLVDYTCSVIEAMCWLWEDQTKTVVANIAERKLNAVWQVIWCDLPSPHQQIAAEVFWNAVNTRFPNKIVYQASAMFGPSLNPGGDAKRVVLDVRPSHVGEIVRLNLRYPS